MTWLPWNGCGGEAAGPLEPGSARSPAVYRCWSSLKGTAAPRSQLGWLTLSQFGPEVAATNVASSWLGIFQSEKVEVVHPDISAPFARQQIDVCAGFLHELNLSAAHPFTTATRGAAHRRFFHLQDSLGI